MDTPQEMEERLWDFIDGRSSAEEKALVDKLISTDPDWKRLYLEFLQVNQAIDQQELETPPLRFTKNVMEQIARYQVAPATGNYINRNVIRGIMAFFLLTITGVFFYFVGQFHWTSSSTTQLISSPYNIADKLSLGKALNSSYVNLFMFVNVILGFILLDRYLQTRKKSRTRETTASGSGS